MRRWSPYVALYFALYLLWNLTSLLSACERGGDYSLILLETERASRLEALVGPYSRFHFHHPGPIVFYLYAIGRVVFGYLATPTGALYLTQLLINAALLSLAFASVKRGEESKFFTPILFALFLLVSIEARGGVLRDIWNPSVAYVSTFAFLLFSASILRGDFTSLIPWVLSACISLSHHVGSAPIVLVIGASSLIKGAYHPSRHTPTSKEIRVSAAILIFSFALPLWEAIKGDSLGNIGEIVRFFLNTEPRHSLTESLRFVSTYISPFFFGTVRREWLVFAVFLLALIPPFLKKERTAKLSSEKALSVLAVVAFVLGVLGARSADGKLYNYLMMYLYAVAAIPFASAASFFLSRVRGSVVYPIIAALPFLTLPIHTLKTRPCQDDLGRAVSEIVSKGKSPIRIYTHDIALWGSVGTLVSKLYRQGEDVCVDKVWGFMFGKDLICVKSPGLSVEVSPKNDVPQGMEGVGLRKGSLVFSP